MKLIDKVNNTVFEVLGERECLQWARYRQEDYLVLEGICVSIHKNDTEVVIEKVVVDND